MNNHNLIYHSDIIESIFTTSNDFTHLCTLIHRHTRIAELDTDTTSKLKGDIFELFAQHFFEWKSLFSTYIVIDDEHDFGVDSFSMNDDGEYAIQVKYRGLNQPPPTYSELCNTYTQATLDFELTLGEGGLILFTNSKDISQHIYRFGSMLDLYDFKRINAETPREFWDHLKSLY